MCGYICTYHNVSLSVYICVDVKSGPAEACTPELGMTGRIPLTDLGRVSTRSYIRTQFTTKGGAARTGYIRVRTI